MRQDDPRPETRPSRSSGDSSVTEETGLSDELLRIEQTPLSERGAGYLQLQERLRIRLENADHDR
ncbi:hypothetical protein C5D34_02880 [Rathayibacter sp. AY1B1]|jgi:hypothetical protein|nr:hypothetical protein C5D08_14390 [Rathayibacter sp. AY1B6]PPI26641.1 hypothetical protein C5D44_06480 [Rathayibacter sp. AY1B5]PPI39152.1 hypothetical protein C5D34_02880 [Rathayibacter sp. AY1B1]